MTEPNIPNGWTIATYAAHNEALRAAEGKFQDERDRRYNEVNIEREKALKIKETADLAALSLAREIQDYKDEKANNLRAQIEGERGFYTTKDELKASVEKLEAVLAPVVQFVVVQQGRKAQTEDTRQQTLGLSGALFAAVGAFVGVGGLIVAGIALALK